MEHIIVNKTIVNSDLFLSCIDSPKPNECYNGAFILSGWIFSIDQKDEVIIRVENNGVVNDESPNTQRDDVVKHFFHSNLTTIPPLKCGFNFTVDATTTIKFYCGKEPAMFVTFSVVNSNIEDELLLLDRLNTYHLKNIVNVESDFQKLINNSTYQYTGNSLAELDNVYWATTEQIKNIKKFITVASSLSFGPKIVNYALKNGNIKISSPLDESMDAFCDCSFYSAPFNYLRFISGDVVFYLIQHFSFCDAIYIPKLGFLHFISVGIDKLQWKEKIAHSTLSFDKKGGPFNSIFIAHDRPYHYNYELALGLFLLEKEQLLEKLPLIALSEEKSFFRPSKLLNENINEIVFDDKYFLPHLNKPGFSILAGHQVIYTANDDIIRKLISELDLILKKNSLITVRTELSTTIIENLKKCNVNLWFGITSQKRKLVNQEEEIARAINIFSAIFDSVGVVIDGWTSPLKKNAEDLKQIDGDNLVAANIKQKIKADNVLYHSIIGLSTEEKLVIAEHVDIFLANQATGSMHIDRMARKYGVTHNSNIWKAVDLAHIHNNSIKIDSSYIFDHEPEGKDQAIVDYSVKPKIIAELMMQQYFKLKSENNRDMQ